MPPATTAESAQRAVIQRSASASGYFLIFSNIDIDPLEIADCNFGPSQTRHSGGPDLA
jgi:hypothetical protein